MTTTLRIRQKGSMKAVFRRLFFTAFFMVLPVANVLLLFTTPVSSDWWHLVWLSPISILCILLAFYAVNDLLGFGRGYYLISSQRGEVVVQQQGSIRNERFNISTQKGNTVEWRARSGSLFVRPAGNRIYCSEEDARKVLSLVEQSTFSQSPV